MEYEVLGLQLKNHHSFDPLTANEKQYEPIENMKLWPMWQNMSKHDSMWQTWQKVTKHDKWNKTWQILKKILVLQDIKKCDKCDKNMMSVKKHKKWEKNLLIWQ